MQCYLPKIDPNMIPAPSEGIEPEKKNRIILFVNINYLFDVVNFQYIHKKLCKTTAPILL